MTIGFLNKTPPFPASSRRSNECRYVKGSFPSISSPTPRPPLELEVRHLSLQADVVASVEAYLQRRLLEFSYSGYRYVNLYLHRYPLPSSFVSDLLRGLVCRYGLHLKQLDAYTYRLFQHPLTKPRQWMQLVQFPGAVIYIRRQADAEFCCSLLRRSGVQYIGIDTEWKPDKEGEDHPTALIQLCIKTPESMKRGSLELPTVKGSEYVCFLLHVVHHGFNSELVALLKDEKIFKIGVEIAGDVKKIKRHGDIEVESTIELHNEVHTEGALRGLRSLFSAVVGCDYPKDKSITISDWERAPLTAQQQNYAACDAYAALRIFECL